MTFWLMVAAILLLMTGHPWWATLALYCAFATISHDDPEPTEPKSETPPDDIDKSG